MRRLRADVDEHNDFLDGFDITLVHHLVRMDGFGFIFIRQRRINPHIRAYCRVFNASWLEGGRWYGPWWQGLSSDVRAGLRIDGEPTVEVDFSACHLRLLSAAAGVTNLTADGRHHYAATDLHRDVAKLATNILLNSSNEAEALGALTREVAIHHSHRGLPPSGYIFAEIKGAFPHLRNLWLTGAGLRLQSIDAEICARVQRSLRKQGIPCLSVHDSFIVPQHAKELLMTVMEREFDRACQRMPNIAFFCREIGAVMN